MWPSQSEAGSFLLHSGHSLNNKAQYIHFCFHIESSLFFWRCRDWLHAFIEIHNVTDSELNPLPQLLVIKLSVMSQFHDTVWETETIYWKKKKESVSLSRHSVCSLQGVGHTAEELSADGTVNMSAYAHTHTNIHMHINTFMPPHWQGAHWSCCHARVCMFLTPHYLVPATDRSDTCVSLSGRLHTHSQPMKSLHKVGLRTSKSTLIPNLLDDPVNVQCLKQKMRAGTVLCFGLIYRAYALKIYDE